MRIRMEYLAIGYIIAYWIINIEIMDVSGSDVIIFLIQRRAIHDFSEAFVSTLSTKISVDAHEATVPVAEPWVACVRACNSASTLIKGRGCLVPRRCIAAQPCGAYNARRHVIRRAREYWDICTLDLRTPLRSLNHRRPPIGKCTRPRLTKPLCKWIHGRLPRSLGCGSFQDIYIYIDIYLERKRGREKERKEGKKKDYISLLFGLN